MPEKPPSDISNSLTINEGKNASIIPVANYDYFTITFNLILKRRQRLSRPKKKTYTAENI